MTDSQQNYVIAAEKTAADLKAPLRDDKIGITFLVTGNLITRWSDIDFDVEYEGSRTDAFSSILLKKAKKNTASEGGKKEKSPLTSAS